jgi:hypothetical protein
MQHQYDKVQPKDIGGICVQAPLLGQGMLSNSPLHPLEVAGWRGPGPQTTTARCEHSSTSPSTIGRDATPQYGVGPTARVL